MEKTESGAFVPRRFEVFGPKIINGRKRFDDEATETRCLTCLPKPMIRTDIPVALPPKFISESQALRNQQLRYRLGQLGKVPASEERITHIGNRMNQILVPLLT